MMAPLSGEVKSNDNRGNTRKVKLLLLMALGTSLSIAMHVKHYFILPTIGFGRDNNVQTVANNNRRPFIDAITNGTSVYASFQSSSSLSPSNATYDMKHKPATAIKQQHQKRTSTESLLPIYLLQPATNQTAQTTWGTLAKLWNRSTHAALALNGASDSSEKAMRLEIENKKLRDQMEKLQVGGAAAAIVSSAAVPAGDMDRVA